MIHFELTLFDRLGNRRPLPTVTFPKASIKTQRGIPFNAQVIKLSLSECTIHSN